MCLLSAARLSEDTEQGRWSILPNSDWWCIQGPKSIISWSSPLLGSSFGQPKEIWISQLGPPPQLETMGKSVYTERSSKISTISFTLPTGFLKRRSSIEINFLRPELVLTAEGFKNATVLCIFCFWTAGTLLTIPLPLETTAAAAASVFESSISFVWITSRGRPQVFNTSSKSVFWYCS